VKASIVIRTYNESRYLPEALRAIKAQQTDGLDHEVIVVDSGSTDGTLDIASLHGCRVVHIEKEQFSFGRSLNLGCSHATGDYLVFISGHCVPSTPSWLTSLVSPLRAGSAAYVYGRQIGGPASKFSETQLFARTYPATSRLPQEGFFCNNANAGLLRSVWERFRFDEELPGLEDMHLGKRLVAAGMKLGYIAEAPVHHHHHETWAQVRRRYEREAIALQHIMPEVHLSLADFVRYVASSVLLDTQSAAKGDALHRKIGEIVLFRSMQFWGSYRGNHDHRRLSKERKEIYFFPK
jgi:glycosyltransferase involved in cell wall biosynthesis